MASKQMLSLTRVAAPNTMLIKISPAGAQLARSRRRHAESRLDFMPDRRPWAETQRSSYPVPVPAPWERPWNDRSAIDCGFLACLIIFAGHLELMENADDQASGSLEFLWCYMKWMN